MTKKLGLDDADIPSPNHKSYLKEIFMNFRTKEHYEIRIAKLKSKSEVMNDKLIKKAMRKLRKLV